MTLLSVLLLWLVWNARLVFAIAWLYIKESTCYVPSLIPRSSPPPVLIACSMRWRRPGKEISVNKASYKSKFYSSEMKPPPSMVPIFGRCLTRVVYLVKSRDMWWKPGWRSTNKASTMVKTWGFRCVCYHPVVLNSKHKDVTTVDLWSIHSPHSSLLLHFWSGS